MATTVSRFFCIAQFPRTSFLSSSPFSPLCNHRFLASKTLSASALNTSRPVGEAVEEEEVLEAFFLDRKLNGDFVTKASDLIFLKALDIVLEEDPRKDDILQAATSRPMREGMLDESDGGFLKLSRTQEWVLGDGVVPLNKKSYAKELEDDSERRKKLDLLNYEALKRELLLLTIGTGTAGTGYCLVTLSVQAAASYAIGVAFRTGITSDDVKDTLEKWVKGSGFALSSPRLVIPASIFGVWILSHQHIPSNFFDFQITPAILGMFAYKGAAFVQVYRDNEDLKFDFPENDLDRSDY